MDLKKCYILGSSGFLGKNLLLHKPENFFCVGIDKSQIDFLNAESFSNIYFSDEIIIDCINVNNGVEEDIFNCNVKGFELFIEHLKHHNFSGKYVYISTISVLDEGALRGSAYVRSKKKAEDHLKESGLDYQIIRISYPFGQHENPQRLLPRLTNQLRNNLPVKLNNIKINLNFIEDVVEAIFNSIGKNQEIFISNNQYVTLGDLVERIRYKLNSSSTIEIESSGTSFMPISETPYTCKYNVLDKVEEVLS